MKMVRKRKAHAKRWRKNRQKQKKNPKKGHPDC